jgi:DNA-binding transcriptional regulator YiaG
MTKKKKPRAAARMKKHRAHVKYAQEAAMAPDALRRIREALKLTQEEFAKELGVRPLTIGLWEGGKTPIAKARMLAIVGLASKLSGQMVRDIETQ